MPRRNNQRSKASKAWQKFYNTKAWKAARAVQLAAHPLCCRCQQAGIITPADVVNHIKPHKGEWSLFTDPDNHESVCKRHHDADIQSEERLGYSKEIGSDGWPVDDRHPANKGMAQ